MTSGVSNNPELRPRWLRPGAIVVAIGLHLSGLLGLTVPRPALPSADNTMEITIAQGTPEVEQPPAPPAPEQPPPPPPPPPPPDPPPVQPTPQQQPPLDPTPPQEQPPDPTPPIETKAAKREVADAPAIPLPRKPKPKPRPKVVKPPRETPTTKEKPETPPPPPPSEAKQNGEQDAHDQAVHARATYAGKVLAAIRSHRPDDSSNSGSVVVNFAINAAGEMTNVTIVHSSGRHELDAAALRMVRAATPGPPPDGSFAGSTTINFVEN